MPFTLEDVANFCWKNKRNKGFKHHAFKQLAEHIIWASDERKLILVADELGICGVCTLSVFPDRIYVHHIVATRNGFKTLVAEAARRFPGYAIQGLRKSKLITFSQKRLWQMIHKD